MRTGDFILSSVLIIVYSFCVISVESDEYNGEKLITTAYIKSGKLDEARQLLKVDLENVAVESYAGYFNVNKTFNSNLFFWFFPAQSKNVPLLLWLQGGPGTSSLFGLFVENGPFFVDKEMRLQNRTYSWTQNHSVIYIDSPVGSGYSFTDKKAGYSKTQEEIAANLYEALVQFFMLFPEYQEAPFYITGESYAGKYVPKLSLKIHNENQNNPLVRINYKGMSLGAGFSDPVSMIDSYGEFLNNMGLIDKEARKHFDEVGEQTRKFIEQENYDAAAQAQDALFGGDIFLYPPYLKNKTGFDFYFNILETELPKEHTYYVKFLEQNFVKKALHVGNATFFDQSLIVPKVLKEDIFKSVKSTVEQLLNLEYKVLLYVGQFDMIVTHLAVTRFWEGMEWQSKPAFVKAERKVWILDGEIGGYVKQSEQLTFVILRRAGHNAPYDAPKSCLELISKFTGDKEL